MSLKSKTTQKLISCLIIFTILTPAVFVSFQSKQAEAQVDPTSVPVADRIAQTFLSTITGSTTSNTTLHFKDYAIEIGKQLLKVAAKRILAKMTQATINWINSGFHGSPLFLENPESFFKDIAKSEIRNLVDLIGYDTFRFPFGKQVALQVIDSYKRQLADNAQYSLSKVINDPDLLVRYRNDFNVGGWNGFLINTQYPQNNYLGFNMIIQQNLASRLEGTLMSPAQKVKDALQQGMGFLSPQMCPPDVNPNYNNGTNEFLKPSFKFDDKAWGAANPEESFIDQRGEIDQGAYNQKYASDKAAAQANWAKVNTCPGGLVSTTPGSVAANQIFGALNTPFLQTALDGAIGNSIAAIFDALLNKLLDTGLNALSSTVNQAPSINDNWSYDGNTLSGGTTTSGTAALNIPQNVSVNVREVASTAISGGTAPYSIKTQPNGVVATAQVSYSSSGAILTVTGIARGVTAVEIQDSSFPMPKTVTVQIAVNAIGDLASNPANISIGINSPFVATISGGQEPYFIKILPNESFAIAVLSGANLIVTGTARGTTYTVIEDSSSPAKKTVTVPITTNGPEDLVIQQSVSVNVGQVTNLSISGGVVPYIVTNQQDVGIATAQIYPATPNILTITGIASGQTSVLVRDSSNPFKIYTVLITVN